MSADQSLKRICVLDRDLLTSQAMARALEREGDFRVVGIATSLDEVRNQVASGGPDFVLVSRFVDSEEVLGLAQWIRASQGDGIPRLVITGLRNDPGVILRYLEAGASGYTLARTSVGGLATRLRRLAKEEVTLSPRLGHLLVQRVAELSEGLRDRGLDLGAVQKLTSRERDVLELLAEDLTNREIAKRLYVSVGTVKSHVHKILGKLNVQNREAAARILRLREAEGGEEDAD